MADGKTEEISVFRTLVKLAALLAALLSDFGKLTALSTCRLPSYQRVREHEVAPFAFESTAFLKSFCCDVRKVATDKDGKEEEKVTAQQISLSFLQRFQYSRYVTALSRCTTFYAGLPSIHIMSLASS